MKNLNEYIKESLLDDFDDIMKSSDKVISQEIRKWVKSNVKTHGGKIGINPKTGEITLPDTYLCIAIKCPIPYYVSFVPFNSSDLWIQHATESDVIAICKNMDKKNEYELRFTYNDNLNRLPKELDGMTGVLKIDSTAPGKDFDFNNNELNLKNFHISGWDKKIYGTKNINIIPGVYDYTDGMYISNVTIDDDFGTIDAPKSIISLNQVNAKKTLFKNLKNVARIDLKRCSDIDLRNCKCNTLMLSNMDNFDYNLLPKELDTLIISLDECNKSPEFLESVRSKIKTKIKKSLDINGVSMDI